MPNRMGEVLQLHLPHLFYQNGLTEFKGVLYYTRIINQIREER